MSDVSDIEELLGKAKRHAARLAWMKTGLVCASTFIGAVVGAGKSAVALGEIVRNIATKEDVAAIAAGQQRQLEDLQMGQRECFDRLASVEPMASYAKECCYKQTQRVDLLFNQPLRVR